MTMWLPRGLAFAVGMVLVRLVQGALINTFPTNAGIISLVLVVLFGIGAFAWALLDGMADARANADPDRRRDLAMRWLLAGLFAGAVSGFTVKQALAADAKGMVDAGVVPLEKRLVIVEQDARHQSDRLELVNKKLDVVMDALRVPYDRRPTTDGGQ